MKIPTRILSGAALFAVALTSAYSQTATTKPVGYRTETIKAGVLNVVGLNLTSAIGAAGTFESAATTTLTDEQGTFTTAFTAGSKLLLKLTSGAGSGVTAEVTGFTATTVTTAQNISSLVTAGTTYELRAADTVASVFGATNSANLLAGSASTGDQLYIVNSTGGFDIVFYSPSGLLGTGWRKVGGGTADAGTTPIFYPDSLIIYRRGATDLPLVVVGHVVTTPTVVGLEAGLNYVSRVLPIGVSLAQSGLDASILKGSATTGDTIYNPDGAGGYTIYFNSPGGLLGEGWRKVGGGTANVGTDLLASGFIYQRRGAAANATLVIPQGLDIQ